MANFSEVLYNLVFDQFLFEGNDTQQVNQQVTELCQLILDINIESVRTEWEKLLSKTRFIGLQNIRENRKMKSKLFLYWNNFIEKVFPVLPIPTEKETGSCTFLLSNKLYNWFLLSIELITNAGCPFILKIV